MYLIHVDLIIEHCFDFQKKSSYALNITMACDCLAGRNPGIPWQRQFTYAREIGF
jgi:hypothetical protein